MLSGQTLVLGRPIAAPVDQERVVVGFISLQLFVLIYFQRLAPFSMPLSVPLVVMLGGLAWMVFTQRMTIASPARFGVYLLFVASCLLSFAFVGGSLPSLLQLCVLYGCLTVSAPISEAGYRTILRRFVAFMVLPAIIIFAQYAYQKLTGLPDIISMNRLLPQSMLVQGYFYEAPFPWNSTFSRPNGFFLLEPSFASAFVAAATIIEITYFRRWYMIALMAGATYYTMGATGLIMLAIAAPFLLIREKPVIIVAAIATIVVALGTAYMTDTPLPVISRMDEMKSESSSGSERLLQPAEKFAEVMLNPSYLIIGEGAGSVVQAVGVQKNGAPKTNIPVINPWPMVKIGHEYGILSMLTYTLLFLLAIAGRFNVPLKFALAVTFLFTGGYLVSPPLLGLMTMLFFAVSPKEVTD
jgi:hypothetical protein